MANVNNALDQTGLETLWNRISAIFLRQSNANTVIDNHISNAGVLTSGTAVTSGELTPTDLDCDTSISVSNGYVVITDSNSSNNSSNS